MSANVPAIGLGPVPESAPQASWAAWLTMMARAINQVGSGILLVLKPGNAPPTPPSGFYLFVDATDNKLKAIGSTGTITDIANP